MHQINNPRLTSLTKSPVLNCCITHYPTGLPNPKASVELHINLFSGVVFSQQMLILCHRTLILQIFICDSLQQKVPLIAEQVAT